MNENDLRVIKTRERIEAAMLELLRTKPLEKITVTELARVAMINKGTFYLHYQDIPDLYQQFFLRLLEKPLLDATFFPEFFDAPEQFLMHLGMALGEGLPSIHTAKQGQSDTMFMDDVCRILCRKLYETGRIEKTMDNDIRLESICYAMLSIMPHYAPDHLPDAHRVISLLIRTLFPQP